MLILLLNSAFGLYLEVKTLRLFVVLFILCGGGIEGDAVVILASYQINESIILSLCSFSLDYPVFSLTNPRTPKFDLESTKMRKQVLKRFLYI